MKEPTIRKKAQTHALPLEEERPLLTRAKAGDSAAMMRLVTQYEPLLKKAAAQPHLKNLRDDARAEGYVSLVRAVHDYDLSRGIPFAAFARQRVYADLLALFRRTLRVWQKETTVAESKEAPFWDLLEDESAADAMTRYERRALLVAAMRTLSARERAVLRLLYREEKTQKEAAAQLGISQQAVASVKKRALQKMREAISR